MPLTSYSPGMPPYSLPKAATVGPTTQITKVGYTPPVATGTPVIAGYQQAYPTFGKVGILADAGDVCDCLNQLVARIEALEALVSNNPTYGVTAT